MYWLSLSSIRCRTDQSFKSKHLLSWIVENLSTRKKLHFPGLNHSVMRCCRTKLNFQMHYWQNWIILNLRGQSRRGGLELEVEQWSDNRTLSISVDQYPLGARIIIWYQWTRYVMYILDVCYIKDYVGGATCWSSNSLLTYVIAPLSSVLNNKGLNNLANFSTQNKFI